LIFQKSNCWLLSLFLFCIFDVRAAELSAPKKAKLIGTQIRVRQKPSAESKIIKLFNGDEELEVVSEGLWSRITAGPYAGGYIKSTLIKIVGEGAAPAAAAPVPPAGWDEKAEERFNDQVEKAFKKKKISAENAQVLMPVYFEKSKSPSGEVQSRVVGANQIEVDSAEFLRLLHKHVADSWFDKPEIKAMTAPWVPVSAFADSGIQVNYDSLKLEILLQVPPELRKMETTSLGDGREGWENETFEKPAGLSSFLNINATETIDSRNTTYADRRAPLQAQLENGTNVKNFVLEANAGYVEDRGDNLSQDKKSFTRQDVRIVRDLPGSAVRAAVGDVIYPVQSFQVYRQMVGVAFYRQFSMSTSKLTYPTGNYDVYLKNKSKVSIWVNDQLQKVIDLPAGLHNLRDFNYTAGMNNVRLEIVDEFGQSETINYSYSASSEMLKPGIHQFSYAAGNTSSLSPTSGEKTYDSANSTISAFHRYGFNEYVTGGANVQHDSNQSIFGLDTNLSLKKGYLRLESAYGKTVDIGSGYAAAASYVYMDYEGPEKTQRSYNIGLIHKSDKFLEFGTVTPPAIAKRLNLSLGHTRGISKTMSLNFGFNYLLNEGLTTNVANSFSLRLGLSKRWNNGMSANVTANHTKTPAGDEDIGVLGFFIWSFPADRQTVSAYGNSTDGSSRVGWNYNPGSGADSASYQANYRQSKVEKGYGATALLNGNRARMGVTHEVVLGAYDEPSTSYDESKSANNVTTMQFGTGLVYAGGVFGIGRPVTDAFAIIAPKKGLSGRRLLVNPDTEGNYLARSTWLGPAVIPEISSYSPMRVNVEAKDLPLGVSVPQDHFNLFPQYKNGYGFPLGNDATIYLQFIVADESGQPIGMAAGQAVSIDDPNAPVITVFTTRKGVMQSEGFKKGRYRLEVATDKYEPIEFVIPDDAKEELDLGVLKLKEKH
jgi:outer membrane usher protein